MSTDSINITTWRPDKTDSQHPRELTLTITDLAEGDFGWGDTPIVEGTDPDGHSWRWVVVGEVAQDEFAACAPEPGLTITAKHVGVPAGKKYRLWKCRRQDGRGRHIDWAKYRAQPEGEQKPPPSSNVPDDGAGYGRPPVNTVAGEPAEKGDGDALPS